MTNRKKELFDSTWDAFRSLPLAADDLSSLAHSVEYVLPKLAEDLGQIAYDVRRCQETLRGDYCERQSIEHKEVSEEIGTTLSLLLGRMERDIEEAKKIG